MKFKLYAFLIAAMCCSVVSLSGQKPGVKWSKTAFSDKLPNEIYDIKLSHDGGYFLAGSDSTRDSYAYNYNGIGVPTVVKVDSTGNVVWKAAQFAYMYNSAGFNSVEPTGDGGCIAAGYIQKPYPENDSANVLIAKLSATGAKEWQRNIGGSAFDLANAVVQTNDNGYLVVGNTHSDNGDVTGFHGISGYLNSDVWIIKLNSNGDILWNKCYGGSGYERGESVVKTADNGFIIAGISNSSDGDLIANNGNEDGWVFKIDANGNLVWQKNMGGNALDIFKSIDAAPDGNFILTGYSTSADGDATGNHGGSDVWVVNMDGSGNINWSKSLGGSANDYGISVSKTSGSNFLIGAATNSTNGNVASNNGASDMWIVMLSSIGDIVWEKTVLTSADEYMGAVAFISENEYIAAGYKFNYSNYSQGYLIKLGNSSTIKGTAFLDNNLNGIKDAGEPSFDQLRITIGKVGYEKNVIPYNGNFHSDVDTGTYTVTATINNPYYTAVPSSHSSILPAYFLTDSISFAVQPIPGIRDIQVSIVPTTVARPGFQASYQIIYKNAGTEQNSSGSIKLVKDSRITIANTVPAYSGIDGDTITWNFTNLSPSSYAVISVQVNLATPPTLNNNDILKVRAFVAPVLEDVNPSNDTSYLNQVVIGSYDPNDKTESHGGSISRDEVAFGGYLNYTIRFQNTGTDTAFAVMVRDTLSSQVNWNTLQMISASHAYNLQINDQNKLVWTFSDIKLVDSNRNEPASHGYVSFRVKPKNTLVPNDVIQNAAGIYFDYNLPVQTNTENTVVIQNVVLPVKLKSFMARLMDQGNVLLNWKTALEQNSDYYEVQRSKDGVHFDKLSTVISKNNISGSNYAVNDPFPFIGANYYRLKSVDKDGSSSYSAIELVNKENGMAILASLYPNPSDGDITLKLTGRVKGNISFSVINISGVLVYQKDLGYLSTDSFIIPLNITRFSKGTYIVKFVVENRIFTQQLIIQ